MSLHELVYRQAEEVVQEQEALHVRVRPACLPAGDGLARREDALGKVLLREAEALPMLLQVLLELHCVSFLDSRCAMAQKITTKCLWHIDLTSQSELTKVFDIASHLVFLLMSQSRPILRRPSSSVLCASA